MKFTFTEAMMVTALEANGWSTGWAGDDWVSPSMNADRGGLSLKDAFEALLRSKNLAGWGLAGCWS